MTTDRVVPGTTPITVTLMGVTYDDVTIERAAYGDGSPALRLWCEDGPLATATVFLSHATPAEGCVWIKDYSENEGMLASLIEAGVIEATGRVERAGFVPVWEARLR